MLVKKTGPDGPYWLRKKFDARAFTFSPRTIEELAGWRDRMPFAALLEERGGPFLGSLEPLGRVDRDGKHWERFSTYTYESCVDVEVKADGWVGAIVAVPPEEAWQIAVGRDPQRKGKVVMEE
jgi:hypothetical protein